MRCATIRVEHPPPRTGRIARVHWDSAVNRALISRVADGTITVWVAPGMSENVVEFVTEGTLSPRFSIWSCAPPFEADTTASAVPPVARTRAGTRRSFFLDFTSLVIQLDIGIDPLRW